MLRWCALLVLCLLVFPVSESYAQPHLAKTAYFGDQGSEGILAGYPNDQGWLLVATTSSKGGMVACSNTNTKISTWLIQIDTAYQIIWQQCYAQEEGTVPWFIEPYGDGTYVIFGESREDTTLLPCHKGSDDLWLLHIDSQGQPISQHCFGGFENEFVYDFIKSSHGTFLVAADYRSNDGDLSPYYASAFVEDAWVFELDSLFNITWSLQWGGTSYDQANAIAEHPHGGYVVAAVSKSNDGDVFTNTGKSDPWLLRLDTAGQVLWQRHYGKPTHEDNLHLLVDSAGYIYLAMETDPIQGVKGGADIRLLKIDTQGNVVHDSYIGGNRVERIDDFKGIDGNLVIAGNSTSTGDGVPGNYGGQDIWLAVVDTQLQVLRSNHYGGSRDELIYSLSTKDNSIFGFGTTNSGDFDFIDNNFATGPNGKSIAFINKWISYPIGIPIPDKQESIDVRIYPNPNNGTFQLVIDEEVLQQAQGTLTWILFDVMGRTRYSGQVAESTSTINLPETAAGLYFLRVAGTHFSAQQQVLVVRP